MKPMSQALRVAILVNPDLDFRSEVRLYENFNTIYFSSFCSKASYISADWFSLICCST